MINGWRIKKDFISADFRSLFTLNYNQYSKTPKTCQQLWPLSIDTINNEKLEIDEIYERNKKIIEQMGSN